MKKLIFPEGTVVKYKGFPCELAQNTPFYSNAIEKIGLEQLNNEEEYSPSLLSTGIEDEVTSSECSSER